MSAPANDTKIAQEHRAANEHDGDAAHGSLKGYMTGFVLSVLLTAVPFYLVMERPLESTAWIGFLVVAFAAVQVVVHMIFFLHMNARAEEGWTFMALMFTLVVVVITLSGTLWVMYNLNTNMMPGDMHDMSQMP
ncbi:cytochrome o ubiquinol oxidase subunit IV [Aureimonas jatrophae]|jgi:cytochrome o ubiquinol oxidase subunit IV|uniref:Cytochrome bo(3) ubiquinol oxidase subunit 4 n=1 Tax=Aureimonas jatrophae TaxID=1166073 RepID=A0A1H0F3R5_9HYPH|nr:cytochrome o ubiquinol oxidase subunit IV [Aureimonas jatrophae]MBB3950193.1 cytochrome o ubiquinol oxidase operon protein cyoD [Aureimonas jatrophae]SDN89298.1 cytochrome bo3 quinol oxidase subunit 4 [Aureimonas jatrophae]